MNSNSKIFTIINWLKFTHNSAKISSENPFFVTSNNAISNGIGGCSSSSRCCYYTRKGRNDGSLYAKISPLGTPGISIKPQLDDWIHKGNKVSVAALFRIIHDLRKRKRFTQALQVSEWMNEKEVCKFTPTEHAVQLDLIGRVHGFLAAESYFNSLLEEYKTEKTYGALLNCYVRQRQLDKSLSQLQLMKEKGFASTPLTFNDVMCLYTNIGQYEKVPEVLTEMKESKVLPDNYSYRLCMNSYGARSDFTSMEKTLKEMETQPHTAVDWNTYAVAANFYIKAGLIEKAADALKKAEVRLDDKDGTGYNHLISLNAKLARKDEILRLWELEKTACKRCLNRDFTNVLESLVKIGALGEAKNVLKEWESSDNCYIFRIPNIVIVGYLEGGLCEKAEAMLEMLMERRKDTSPNTWDMLATRYLEKGEMQKALRCEKVALSLYDKNKGWKPNNIVVTGVLSWVGDQGSLEDATTFVESLRKVIPVSVEMYHALIKVNIRYGENVDGLLKEMKDDNLEEDTETKEMLNTIQNQT